VFFKSWLGIEIINYLNYESYLNYHTILLSFYRNIEYKIIVCDMGLTEIKCCQVSLNENNLILQTDLNTARTYFSFKGEVQVLELQGLKLLRGKDVFWGLILFHFFAN